MSDNINLLVLRRREKIKSKKGLVAARVSAVLYLILIVALSITVFHFRGKFSLNTAKEKEASFLNSMAPFRSREAKLLLIKDRITGISEILNRREKVIKQKSEEAANYGQVIASFRGKIPQDVVVNTLKADKSQVVLNVSSSSLLTIEEMINGLVSLGQDKTISELLLDSLSLSEDKSTYSVLITASL